MCYKKSPLSNSIYESAAARTFLIFNEEGIDNMFDFKKAKRIMTDDDYIKFLDNYYTHNPLPDNVQNYTVLYYAVHIDKKWARARLFELFLNDIGDVTTKEETQELLKLINVLKKYMSKKDIINSLLF